MKNALGNQTSDVLRVFSGDGPARQFEAGHQRGGNYSCLCRIPSKEHANLEYAFSQEPVSINKRIDILKSGILWRRFSLNNPSPFTSLSKDDLQYELEHRGVNTLHILKPELESCLQETLCGIQRPPALFCSTQREDVMLNSILSNYEIPACEPLHDISSVVQNIITELPHHVSNKEIQKEFENFYHTTFGDKIN